MASARSAMRIYAIRSGHVATRRFPLLADDTMSEQLLLLFALICREYATVWTWSPDRRLESTILYLVEEDVPPRPRSLNIGLHR